VSSGNGPPSGCTPGSPNAECCTGVCSTSGPWCQ
jgi:hypothetical protein